MGNEAESCRMENIEKRETGYKQTLEAPQTQDDVSLSQHSLEHERKMNLNMTIFFLLHHSQHCILIFVKVNTFITQSCI